MKVLVAVISALVLIGTYSGGAEARGARVTLTINCESNPQTLTVANTGPVPFTVLDIMPEGGDPFSGPLPDKIAPGRRITYQSGPLASGPHVISRRLIFESHADMRGGAFVHIVPEGVGAKLFTDAGRKEGVTLVFCDQHTRTYRVSTDTFELTLYGTVPRMQSFEVRQSFSAQQEIFGPAIPVCQDSKAEIPSDKPAPACRGGGSIQSLTVPQITTPQRRLQAVQWIRRSYADCTIPVWRDRDCTPQDQTFYTSKVGVDAQGTHKAWYDFDTGRGGSGEGPGGRMPGGMPTTGGGGMAGSDGQGCITWCRLAQSSLSYGLLEQSGPCWNVFNRTTWTGSHGNLGRLQ
ncbi:MAG: hypothetical protein M3P51_07235 [Chloroflexota bacterium]|nr:hypothetical protein [Chloroflexota bacterium]